jgi:drug/metabolite transporter (DMT)-like permease
MSMSRVSRWTGENVVVLAALAVVVIWGTNFVFVKAAFEEFDLGTFLLLRYAGMIALAWAVIAVMSKRGNASVVRIEWGDIPRTIVAGLLGFTVYVSLSMVGLHYTTAFSNALLLATAPMFAALLLWRLRMETISAGQVAAMAIAFCGVTLFLWEKLEDGAGSASLGDLISLAAAFFFAAYTVANKPLLSRYPAQTVTAWTLTIGALPVLLVSAPALWTQDWTAISLMGWVVMAWSIVLPIYVAWTIWAWVNHRDGVARTSMFIYLVPIVGGVTAWLLLDEHFGGQKIAGAALTMAGLVLARRWSTKAREQHVPAAATVASD